MKTKIAIVIIGVTAIVSTIAVTRTIDIVEPCKEINQSTTTVIREGDCI